MFVTEDDTRPTKIIVATVVILNSILQVCAFNKKEDGLIYILLWTPAGWAPFNKIPMNRKAFENCTYNNCFLSGNRSYLNNIMDFDVLMFDVVQIHTSPLNSESIVSLPSNRSESQKYCMFAWEPARFYQIPESWNGFFNMTFTYKLTSNASIPYIVVMDLNDQKIGPKIDMHWMKLSEMNETSDYVKNKLQNKHIAAAWIVSHCESPWRKFYAQNLRKELAQYGHKLDIFGKCGAIQCPKGEMMDDCFASIESDYYFYLSFENSFNDDYITEKLSHALEHFAVPVVYGGANYSRFIPEGIYLNANVLAPEQMAEKMDEIIKDKNKYYEFFKWHDHYSFHFSGEDLYSRELCGLCAFLNNSKNNTGIMDNITLWWNVDWPPLWSEEVEEQNEVEKIVSNVLNILDPLSD